MGGASRTAYDTRMYYLIAADVGYPNHCQHVMPHDIRSPPSHEESEFFKKVYLAAEDTHHTLPARRLGLL